MTDGFSNDFDEDYEEYDDDLDDEDSGVETIVTVEVNGLSLFTHMGVTEEERKVGQRLVLDLRIDVGECDALITDRVEDTVDYGKVCQTAWLVAQQKSYLTLERLGSVLADRLISDYDAQTVCVKISKPEPPLPFAVEDVAVEIWREAN